VALDAARWIRAADRGSDAADLYSGRAGVVLFFLELYRATGDAAHRATATAGADALLDSLERQADAGLYTGLAGIGFVLSEVGRHTAHERYRDGARRVAATLRDRAAAHGTGVEWNDTTDVISGSAGIGLFLLDAAEALDIPDGRDLAARAGRRLLERGRDDRGGRAWPMDDASALLFPNFAHGTAGVAYFLATLYQATGEAAFLDGALAGASHLKAIARTDGDVCLVPHHEPEAAGAPLHYLGWCHGPAGTARLWYRLWQATGDPAWLEWTGKSARAILASGIPGRETPGFWNNAGLCCGSAGIARFFLGLHRVTGDAGYLAFARQVGAHLLAAATRDESGTRWIHAEHRVRPLDLAAQTGWMQGAAGIGACLLDLDAFQCGAPLPIPLPDAPF